MTAQHLKVAAHPAPHVYLGRPARLVVAVVDVVVAVVVVAVVVVLAA